MHLIGHDNVWMNAFYILKDHFVPIAKNNSLLSDFTFCQKKYQYLTYFTLACYFTWSLWGSEVILFGLCMFKSRLLKETLTLKMRTSSSLSEGGEGEEHWSRHVSKILLHRILAQKLFIAGEVKIKVPCIFSALARYHRYLNLKRITQREHKNLKGELLKMCSNPPIFSFLDRIRLQNDSRGLEWRPIQAITQPFLFFATRLQWNEVLRITNHFLYPSKSKIHGKGPRCNGRNFVEATKFASPSTLRYTEVLV